MFAFGKLLQRHQEASGAAAEHALHMLLQAAATVISQVLKVCPSLALQLLPQNDVQCLIGASSAAHRSAQLD